MACNILVVNIAANCDRLWDSVVHGGCMVSKYLIVVLISKAKFLNQFHALKNSAVVKS